MVDMGMESWNCIVESSWYFYRPVACWVYLVYVVIVVVLGILVDSW